MRPEPAILVPAPTPWPFVTAFGLTLMFAGLVTHVAVSIVGMVVTTCGAIGWWRDVLPVERHESIAVVDDAFEPTVASSRRAVEHLVVGTSGHRVRVPIEVHPYSAGLFAGVAGAAAMAIVAIAYGVLAERSVWYVVNLLAAGVVPSLAAADVELLRAFSGVGLAVGAGLHVTLSALIGVLYAVLLPMFPRRAGIWSGLATPVVWSGIVFATLDVVNPTLNGRIDWIWFVASQVAFGLTCGYVVARTERIETRQTWSLDSRAGLEARRVES
jgi:hypothetical protein